MKAILSEDIFSHFNKAKGKRKQYGSAGDTVIIISECGNVTIVQDVKGERFPVRSDLLRRL